MGNEIMKIIEENLLNQGSFKEMASRQTSVLAKILDFDNRERLATISFIDPTSGKKTIIKGAEVPLKGTIFGKDFEVGDLVLAIFASGSLHRAMIVARYLKRTEDEDDENKENPGQSVVTITI